MIERFMGMFGPKGVPTARPETSAGVPGIETAETNEQADMWATLESWAAEFGMKPEYVRERFKVDAQGKVVAPDDLKLIGLKDAVATLPLIQEVRGTMDISQSDPDSFHMLPRRIGGDLVFFHNKLTSLDGLEGMSVGGKLKGFTKAQSALAQQAKERGFDVEMP